MKKHLLRSSKFLSLVLRHDPAAIALQLDPQGWADVAEVLSRLAAAGHPLSPEELEEIVATNEKKRFVIEGGRIRAQQGHSIDIELGLEPVVPPEVLFHGSAERNRASILQKGLHAAARQHVHLSHEADTARQVGSRHGRPLIFLVASGAMHCAGHTFYRSGNGVWLCDR
ncbi:MAG TPA: RNA 2'-phosphotransferase, partial [Myxococcota bacterium]|nr:RNA 2'-phosphotransferase [Myxococcota bacterium]